MSNTTNDDVGECTSTDWESLGKRLLVAMQLGVRISQEDGHRWYHLDGGSTYFAEYLKTVRHKQYGSYSSVLDELDQVLSQHGKKSLIDQYDDLINYWPDADHAVVFGSGVQ
jgi:hypothetical protein